MSSPAPQIPSACRRILAIADRSPRRAVALAERAVAAAPESAWARLTLGRCLLSWERFAEAGAALAAALAAFEAQPSPLGVAHCRLGLLLRDVLIDPRPELDGELAALERVFADLGAPQMAAATRLERARCLNALGRPTDSARLLGQIAPGLWPADAPEIGRVRRMEAIIAYRQGDFARAGALLDQAERIFARRRSAINLARCWFERAAIASYTEDFATSQAFLARAEPVFRRAGTLMQLAFCDNGIGLIAMRQGRYDEALRHTLRARDAFARIGRSRDVAVCTLHIGNIYLYSGRWDAAVAAYTLSEEAFRAAGVVSHLILSRRNRAMAYRALGRVAEAQELLAAAEHLAEHSGNRAELAEIWSVQATLLADTGQIEAGIARYEQARSQFARAGNRAAAAECRLECGWLQLGRGEVAAAEAQFAAAAPDLSQHPHHAWRAAYGLGSCAERRGDLTAAQRHIQRACAIVAGLRGRLASEQLSSSLYDQAARLYADALRLSADQGDPLAELLTIEGQRALTLRRLLVAPQRGSSDSAGPAEQINALIESHPGGTPELERALVAYSEHLLYERHLAEPPLPAAQMLDFGLDLPRLRSVLAAAFGDGWTAVSYSLADGSLWVVCLTPSELSVERVEMTAATAHLIAQVSRDSYRLYTYSDLPLLQGLTSRPWERVARLTELLLPAQARARLGPDHRLLLVPAGPLHGIPWAALRLGDRWLAEQAIIHMLPALAVAPILAARRSAGDIALLAGCSTFQGRARPLPNVAAELAAGARQWPGPAQILLDADATRAGLRAACADAGERLAILHLASHGWQMPAHGLAAHIKLWEENLLLPEIVALELAGATVILSACEGAAADVLAGEEVLSLSWAFLAAGAGAVLASVWPLPDQELRLLMEMVYRELAAGADPALALTLAQRAAMARAAEEDVGDPQIWGALQVIAGLWVNR